MRIALLNFALPEPDSDGGTRWWHKSGSRWPASIRDRRNDGSEYFPWPFLLCYLASLLRRDGHEVTLVDACLDKLTLAEALERTRALDPDYVVFETSEQTEAGDRAVAAALSFARVVLVGPNVQEDRLDLLEWDGVWAAVPGEPLLSVADLFADPAPGMARRREIVGTAAMDALPFALRDPHAFPRYNARFKTTPPGVQGQFVSMWGCQYRCKFCIWIHAYWSRSSQLQKQFSIERIEAELRDLDARFGVTSFYDDSDNHYYRGDTAYEFAETMGRLGKPWALLCRADTYLTRDGGIDLAKWRAYRDNGCYAVKIGVEGVQEVMDATNKRLSEEVVREFVPLMQDLGIAVYASFMVGVPNTGADADRRTLELVDTLAGYRPELFEYFVSACDVTRVTPFVGDVPDLGRHDGQLHAEELFATGALSTRLLTLEPNNL